MLEASNITEQNRIGKPMIFLDKTKSKEIIRSDYKVRINGHNIRAVFETMVNYNKIMKITDWNVLIDSYDVQAITEAMPFKEAVILAYRMLYNKSWDEEIQNYAVELLYAIRKKHAKEWNACWKLDVLWGMACNITLRYDERYLVYKRACDRLSTVPPSLMVL